jgi:hypothetical protein
MAHVPINSNSNSNIGNGVAVPRVSLDSEPDLHPLRRGSGHDAPLLFPPPTPVGATSTNGQHHHHAILANNDSPVVSASSSPAHPSGAPISRMAAFTPSTPPLTPAAAAAIHASPSPPLLPLHPTTTVASMAPLAVIPPQQLPPLAVVATSTSVRASNNNGIIQPLVPPLVAAPWLLPADRTDSASFSSSSQQLPSLQLTLPTSPVLSVQPRLTTLSTLTSLSPLPPSRVSIPAFASPHGRPLHLSSTIAASSSRAPVSPYDSSVGDTPDRPNSAPATIHTHLNNNIHSPHGHHSHHQHHHHNHNHHHRDSFQPLRPSGSGRFGQQMVLPDGSPAIVYRFPSAPTSHVLSPRHQQQAPPAMISPDWSVYHSDEDEDDGSLSPTDTNPTTTTDGKMPSGAPTNLRLPSDNNSNGNGSDGPSGGVSPLQRASSLERPMTPKMRPSMVMAPLSPSLASLVADCAWNGNICANPLLHVPSQH